MSTNRERTVNGIRAINLHGKDYVDVAERLRIVHELKKEFEVLESQPVAFGDRCVWRVVITVDGKRYTGNAEAKMNAPKNTPDGTNPFECAETSALGRALAFAGFGTIESIASYDEIARAQPFQKVIEEAPQNRIVEAQKPRQLPQPTPATSEAVQAIQGLLSAYAEAHPEVDTQGKYWGRALIREALEIAANDPMPSAYTPDDVIRLEYHLKSKQQKSA